MFLHKGKSRTNAHNLSLASLLSLVAGLVNVVGFFSVAVLTTNVTGHFAFMVKEVFALKYTAALHVFLYVLMFFLGAFFSNFLVEKIYRLRESRMYVIPTLIEAGILLCLGIWGEALLNYSPDLIALLLLFAMGMQNSLVTTISNSVVRTTHLTGLFTDLGIECSQLFFYSDLKKKAQLYRSIRLRLIIILMFFLGGILGGVLFSYLGIASLLVGGILLIFGLVRDLLKVQHALYRRKRYG